VSLFRRSQEIDLAGVRDAVGGERALLTLLAYTVVFTAIAAHTTRRRDIV